MNTRRELCVSELQQKAQALLIKQWPVMLRHGLTCALAMCFSLGLAGSWSCENVTRSRTTTLFETARTKALKEARIFCGRRLELLRVAARKHSIERFLQANPGSPFLPCLLLGSIISTLDGRTGGARTTYKSYPSCILASDHATLQTLLRTSHIMPGRRSEQE